MFQVSASGRRAAVGGELEGRGADAEAEVGGALPVQRVVDGAVAGPRVRADLVVLEAARGQRVVRRGVELGERILVERHEPAVAHARAKCRAIFDRQLVDREVIDLRQWRLNELPDENSDEDWDDDRELYGPDGLRVETWREGYPYGERMQRR